MNMAREQYTRNEGAINPMGRLQKHYKEDGRYKMILGDMSM